MEKFKDYFLNFYDNYVAIIFIILAVLFSAYNPVLQFSYVFHDDWYFFSLWNKKSCEGYSQLDMYVKNYGRPIGGYIKCFYGMSFDTVSAAKYVRAFNIFLLSSYAFLVFGYLRSFKISKYLSLIIVLFISLLTSYQTPIAQITNAHHIFAAIFALSGLMVALKSVNYSTYFIKENIKIQVLAYALLTISVLIYQPATMLFWSFLSLYVVFVVQNITIKEIKKLFYISVPCFLAMITSFLYLKIMHSSRGKIGLNFEIKVKWIKEVIPIIFSYWEVLPNVILMYSSIGILFLIGFIVICKIFKSKYKKNIIILFFIKILACLCLFFLSISPSLFANEYAVNHRILIAPKTIIVIFVLLSFSYIISNYFEENKEKIIITILLLLLTLGTFRAQYNMMHYYANPLSLEYDFLSRKLEGIDFTNNQTYHIIKPNLPYLSKVHFADEFGMPSSFFPGDFYNMIVAITKEKKINITSEDIFLDKYFTWGNEKVIELPQLVKGKNIPSTSIIIDMNKIRGITFNNKGKSHANN